MNSRGDKHPLISIIIPTYQAGNTLERALESITEQTFQSWEVLIMDGGSTDDTANIAADFSRRFPRIRFHAESDGGVYVAMNKGLRIANGQWLYFLGSDDRLYSSETLERVATHLSSDWDVVYGNVTSPRFGGIYDGEFTSTKILSQNICHQAIFYNRVIFEQLGDYTQKYCLNADWEFNFRWFLSPQVKKVFVDEVIANYADGGLSSRESDSLFEEERMLLYLRHGKEVLNFRVKNSIAFSELKRAIRTLNFRLLGRMLLTAARAYF